MRLTTCNGSFRTVSEHQSLCLSHSYHSDHENGARDLQQQKTELELQFPTLCLPDPDLAGLYTS